VDNATMRAATHFPQAPAPICRTRKGLTQSWSSTIVRAMNGHHSIFGICREIIR
jgi:hypothetical protein